MKIPLNFDGPAQFVGVGEITELPVCVQAAWAAFCVGAVGPLLPSSFHSRYPFEQCVRAAWDFALDRPLDYEELNRLDERLTYESAVLGQWEKPPARDNPGYWMLAEDYRLEHALAPLSLLPLIFKTEHSADFAEEAVENAGLVYKDYQFWRQGFDDVAKEAHYYVEYVLNVFYSMSRQAYEVARVHVGSPTEGMFATVEFPRDCELLPTELAELSRRRPTPAHHEKWLRDIGRWLGPA